MNEPDPSLIPVAWPHKVTGLMLQSDPWVYLPPYIADQIRAQRQILENQHGERPGPRSFTFRYLAELAAVYEASSRVGFKPTEQVAQWGDMSRAAAEKQILRARTFRFLPSPMVGRRQAWVDVESSKPT